jgi:PII-like signaling protein
MNTVCLRIFAPESSRHHGMPTYEWLLDTAQALGVAGGSAFRALAGFGRHGRHDAGFFELAGELPVAVEFLLDAAAADRLLQAVKDAGLQLIYARWPVQLGVTTSVGSS